MLCGLPVPDENRPLGTSRSSEISLVLLAFIGVLYAIDPTEAGFGGSDGEIGRFFYTARKLLKNKEKSAFQPAGNLLSFPRCLLRK